MTKMYSDLNDFRNLTTQTDVKQNNTTLESTQSMKTSVKAKVI